jgi:hypothetical protein
MFLADRMALDRMKMIMLAATIVWFVSASLWMWNEDEQKKESNA